MSFIRAFTEARLRKLYPGAELHVERAYDGDYYTVAFTIPGRDVALSRYDHAEVARRLDRKLTPRTAPARRHWSLLRSKA